MVYFRNQNQLLDKGMLKILFAENFLIQINLPENYSFC